MHLHSTAFNLRIILLVGLLSFLMTNILKSQGLREFHAKRAVDEIVLDGEMNEKSWEIADIANDFYLNSPNDTAAPSSQTELRMVFDQKAVYFFAIMEDSSAKPYVIESLRRDWGFPRTDNLSIYIDPFNDKTTGFSFGLSPYGAQREGLVFEGENVSTEWDNVWYSEVKKYENYWTAEIKIPFKTLRYNDESKFWNVIFLRNDLKYNEVSTWTPVPQQFNGSNLGYSGSIIFDDSLPKPGPNITLIPFVAGRDVRNFNEDNSFRELEIGGDAKIGITPSLNLDLTFNPDFSQVEVDRQVTNLDRFELFFPERRQFFLENDDLFGRLGFPRTRVFFSRRIGLNRPILYGARLTGKASDNLRIGFFNVQEGGNSRRDTLDNSTVAILQRKIFDRSNITAVFTNRQGYRPFSDSLANTGFLAEDYNRAYGFEYNLLSSDNKWIGDISLYRSNTPGKNKNNYGHSGFIGYNSRNFFVGWGQEMIGENYQLDLGFLPRTGYYKFGPNFRYTFYPNKNGVIRHGPDANYEIFTNQDWERTDQYMNAGYSVRFLNTSELSVNLNNTYILLQDDFIIGFNENQRDTLNAGEDFNWNEYRLNYSTDVRKKINGGVALQYGGFYSSIRYNARGFINWRFQPFGAFGIDLDYNYLDLSAEGKDAGNLLISPRLDLTLSDKVFLTTFVQYNEQINNFNINSRFQWRFKPVSDFFIVYTENYFSDTFVAKSRALVFKLTYWFNV